MDCLAENTVVGFLRGDIPAESAVRVEKHIDHCVSCRELLAEVAKTSFAAGTPQPDPPPAAPEPKGEPERGTLIGRYIVIGPVGAGGMGVVYAAYDPELNRKIALKVIKTGSLPREVEAHASGMLLREAQAMARLAHPNVIAVHDVGTYEGQVFVAMEFVEGRTLKQWLVPEPPWRDVLSTFVRAGRGLAAAHAGGLVHRDFKPDNVLVGADDRVRVTDFGLARPVAPAPSAGGGKRPATDGMVGTPAYMSPEQHEGRPADAKSDQFCFCVALYEGLYGERPFNGRTISQLGAEVRAGRVKAPSRRVPWWVRKVLLRGLSVDPADRYPSMDALLADLRRRGVVQRWKVGGRIAAVAAVALGLAAWGLWPRGVKAPVALPHPCAGAEQRLAGVWDGAKKAEVRAAFRATGAPFADAAADSAEKALDDYTAAWVAMEKDSCEATLVRGEQSGELLDLRAGCLNRRLGEVDAVAGVLAHADPTVVEHAADTVAGLDRLSACADAETLRAHARMPDDPQVRARIEALNKELDHGKALEDAGRFTDALAALRKLEAPAAALGYRPLEAEVDYYLGETLDVAADTAGAEKTLENALLAAEAGHHDEIAADAATYLVYVTGYEGGRDADADRWSRRATAAIERIGGDPKLTAKLEYYLGVTDWRAARFADARKHLEASEATWAKVAPEGQGMSGTIDALGLVAADEGKLDEALGYHQRALALREKTFGKSHPFVALSLDHVATVETQKELYDQALSHFQQALAIREQAVGADRVEVADSLLNIGEIHDRQGRLDDALSFTQRALAIYQKTGGETRDVAQAELNLGGIRLDQRRFADAVAPLTAARDLFARLEGPTHPDVAECLHGLGLAHSYLGRRSEAVRELTSALQILQSTEGYDPEVVAELRSDLAAARKR